ncbi:MAG: hypothetical protein NUW37_08270 [Planctomycetes bacterium]|nr:hypothetical protein [Planctomycetota bacterium]
MKTWGHRIHHRFIIAALAAITFFACGGDDASNGGGTGGAEPFEFPAPGRPAAPARDPAAERSAQVRKAVEDFLLYSKGANWTRVGELMVPEARVALANLLRMDDASISPPAGTFSVKQDVEYPSEGVSRVTIAGANSGQMFIVLAESEGKWLIRGFIEGQDPSAAETRFATVYANARRREVE